MIRFKKIIFFILLLMLFLPYIQKSTKLFKLKPLQGYFVYSTEPKFTYANWLSGKYQDSLNIFIEENIGLRPLLIRINNQIAFNISNVALANGVLIGKDNVLFQEMYIKSLWGDDFIGDSLIVKKVIKLAYIQNKLKEKGRSLIFLLAPGKASYYENKIPSKFFEKPKSKNNYEVCVKEMKKHNINLIDMRSFFLQMKEKSPYPLFPRGGIHWSGYGLTLVADTFFKYMEKISGIDLVDFYAEKGEITSTNMRFTDNDIGDAMNLLWNIPNYKMYYPNIIFDSDSLKKKPVVLGIGDSFGQSFWGFYPYFSTLFNNKSQYWSYFRTYCMPREYEGQDVPVNKFDFETELLNYDIIYIVSTEQNLVQLGFGFIEKVYDDLAKNDPTAPYKDKADSLIYFNYTNSEYVTKLVDNKTIFYKIKAGAPGTSLFLQCDNFIVEPDIQYSLAFKAKGFKSIQLDLYPDNYQRFSTHEIKSDIFKEFQWIIQLNKRQTGTSLRIFMDEIPTMTEDLVIGDFKLKKIN